MSIQVYGHDPVDVGIRGIPVGFSLMVGAVIVLWLLSVFRGANRLLMVISSVLMTAGCGAMAVGRVDNMYQLWGILVLAGLGIGGIVVPASIITMIICPDDLMATVAALTLSIRVIGGSIGYCIYCERFHNKAVPFVHFSSREDAPVSGANKTVLLYQYWESEILLFFSKQALTPIAIR